METYGHGALGFVFFHGRNDLFKGHRSTVKNTAPRFRVLQQVRVHERTGVNNLICRFQQGLTADCNEIRCARAGAYKMYHMLCRIRYIV